MFLKSLEIAVWTNFRCCHVCFVWHGMRGGVSSISKRYKGNNKYLKSYDPKQESNYT